MVDPPDASGSDRDDVWTVPMSAPDLGDGELEAVSRALRSSRLSQGSFLAEFERLLGDYLGVPSVTAVSSGTAALHLALRAAGVETGDTVFTSSFSFVATANAVLYLGARPVFVDVERATGNLDPERLEEAIRQRLRARPAQRLKAVLPVHVFGQPADMTSILRIADRYGLAVVEDACEALGSEHRGRKAGTFGGAAAFGFYPNKQITTGEGGAVVTRRPEWEEPLRSWRNQGRGNAGKAFQHVRLGYNYRLDELSAALGVAQMGRLPQILERRRRTAALYRERLAGLEGVELPAPAPATTFMSWFVYVIRARSRPSRDSIRDSLARQGVPSRVYFEPIHLQPSYRDLRPEAAAEGLEVTEWLGGVSLALPFSGVMSRRQVDWVARCLEQAVAATPD